LVKNVANDYDVPPYLPWLSGAELAVAAEDFPDSCGQHREGETGDVRIKPTNHRPESS